MPESYQRVENSPITAHFAVDPVPRDVPAVNDDDLEIAYPKVGDTFAGFLLLAELGRGAFGRVFLARQGKLADRPVALKVTSELPDEAQMLAQLQHTHIVPVYSVHRVGQLRAVCMPFFGAATLADLVLRLRDGLPLSADLIVSTVRGRRSSTHFHDSSASDPSSDGSAPVPLPPEVERLDAIVGAAYVPAVLRLGVQIASALAHAHARGIVHRDLKPANVLLTDEGQAMVLDFNLADDGKSLIRAGGTLPYMAPEMLRSLRDRVPGKLDGRADVYALGLLLYELLACRPPFPRPAGNSPEKLDAALTVRTVVPSLRAHNAAVTPAIEAIVRRCLAFDRDERYALAEHVVDDLECHLADRPLKHQPEPSVRERLAKWGRRHPRLGAASTVGTAALIAVGMLGATAWAWRDRALNRAAVDQYRGFAAVADRHQSGLIREPDAMQRPVHRDAVAAALAEYGLPARADWSQREAVRRLPPPERDALTARAAELLLLLAEAELDLNKGQDAAGNALACNDRAGEAFGPERRPKAWFDQRARVFDRVGDATAAAAARKERDAAGASGAQVRYLDGVNEYAAGSYAEAAKLFDETLTVAPDHYWARLRRAACHAQLGQIDQALAGYAACAAARPEHAAAHVNLGRLYAGRMQHRVAEPLLARAVELMPDDPDIRVELGRARTFLRKPAEARADFDVALAKPNAPLRAYLFRADLRAATGDAAGAAADWAEADSHEPITDADASHRGLDRLNRRHDPAGALADFQLAERIDPRSYHGLENQAHVLSEHLKRPADAVAALDRLLAFYPDAVQALAGRAVVLARLGRVDEALRDARRCLALNPPPFFRYQVAGAFALTADKPGHLAESLRLLSGALLEGAGVTELPSDPDLDAIRGTPEFQKLSAAVNALRQFRDAKP